MLNAIYGEQVRGSLVELFEEDYNLVKRGISVGTEVESSASSVEGYYDGNVYINSDTLDIFKCDGVVWYKVGNLKGIKSIEIVQSVEDGEASVITFETTDGLTRGFQVFNGKTGEKGDTGVSINNAVDNGDGTFYLTKSDGTRTDSIQTIQGLPGEPGKDGQDGHDVV